MEKTRINRSHSTKFKAQVAKDALREGGTQGEAAAGGCACFR